MVERKDIISAYEQTGSMRAVSIELGVSRKTVKKYVEEYLAAKNAGDEAPVKLTITAGRIALANEALLKFIRIAKCHTDVVTH